MEEKMLRILTVAMAAMCIAVCGLMFLFGHVKETQSAMVETEKQKETEQSMTGVELLDYNTGAAPEEEVQFAEQIRITLPEGIKADDVDLQNDYLNKTITVSIPDAGMDFLNYNPVLGGSNNIEDIRYWSDESTLYIQFVMGRILEPRSNSDDKFLYLDFLTPHQVYEKVVVIDAGHGDTMPGCVVGEDYEKTINLEITLKLKEILDKQDEIGVYYTRLDDTNPDFPVRSGMANDVEADLFISIHQNAIDSASYVNGTAVMYNENDIDRKNNGRNLAKIMLSQLTTNLGSKDMGIIKGSNIYILRTSEVPAVLIEVGFMSNKMELQKLTSEEYQKQVAEQIYQGMLAAFENGF